MVAGQPDGEPLWRHPAFLWTFIPLAIAAVLAPLWWSPVEASLYEVEFAIAALLPASRIAAVGVFMLPLVAFAAGLLASLSPCVLPLVPLNLAYIGAAEASGWRSVGLSARFVVGAALVLTLLGLFGDLAGLLLVEQRGVVLGVVGLSLVYFGLVTLELAPLPFGGRSIAATRRLGPVGAGAAFSLITTPCASPLLAAVLAASAAQAVPGLAVVSMAAFSLGYTLLVFLGGVFGGGLVARARRIQFAAPRAAAAALLVVSGTSFVAAGATWF
jgi:cytochrome c-type biogenesis protein